MEILVLMMVEEEEEVVGFMVAVVDTVQVEEVGQVLWTKM
jgi:hypothetical protein